MTLPHKHQHHLTPKHMVGLQRDQFYNRILLIVTFVVVLAVIGLVGWTSIYQGIVGPRLTVAEVEGHKITGKQFQTQVRVNRATIINNYMQYVQLLSMFGNDPTTQQQGYQYLSQLASQLDPSSVGNSTINQMVDDQLLSLEAATMEVTVSEQQIDEQIQSVLNYYPSGTPTSTPVTPTSTPFATSTLSATQMAIVSLTPTLAETATPTLSGSETATITPTATATEIGSATPTAGPSPTDVPTATAYTAEGYATAQADYFASLTAQLHMTQEETRNYFRASLLRQAMFDKVTSGLPHEEEEVWARHILVADQATAQEVLDKLSAGEDWAALASQYSTDTSNKDTGGDLGWFNDTTMVKEFSDAAFALKIGEISAPIETQFGWHIIQVLGHETRPLTDDAYKQLQQTRFQEFINGLRDKYSWTIYDNWLALTPTDPDIPAQYQLQQQ